MSTPTQVQANRRNAEKSTGPVTAEGKARVSKNAIKLGLFSVTSFVRPEEQDTFAEFESGYMAELSPASPLEETLACEIIHAAWRLRRCANLESAPPEDITNEELDRLQASIDRARATAQRAFHRALAELRRLQTERVFRSIAVRAGGVPRDSAKQSQSQSASIARNERAGLTQAESTGQALSPDKNSMPASPVVRAVVRVSRNAPCPCGSRDKYKRCCGKNAPPMLSALHAHEAGQPV